MTADGQSKAAHRATMMRNALQAAQIQDGLIPADSPSGFVREDWQQRSDGLPDWFGPEYHPTDEALASFSEPLDRRVASSDTEPLFRK